MNRELSSATTLDYAASNAYVKPEGMERWAECGALGEEPVAWRVFPSAGCSARQTSARERCPERARRVDTQVTAGDGKSRPGDFPARDVDDY